MTLTIQLITALLFLLETQPHGEIWEVALYGQQFQGEKLEIMRSRPNYTITTFDERELSLKRVSEESSLFVLNQDGNTSIMDITQMMNDYLDRKQVYVFLEASDQDSFQDTAPPISSEFEQGSAVSGSSPNETQESGNTLTPSSGDQTDSQYLTPVTLSTIGSVVALSFENTHLLLARIE